MKKSRLIFDCVMLTLNGVWIGMLAAVFALGIMAPMYVPWMVSGCALCGFVTVSTVIDLVKMTREVKLQEDVLRRCLNS